MDRLTKWIYILGISFFIVGLRFTLSWSYTSRWLGLFLLCTSLVALYFNYIKDKRRLDKSQINIKQAGMGLLLIIADMSYNLYFQDEFKYFDFGILITGLLIILLNMNTLRFFRLDKSAITFSTYFIFIFLVLYGLLFELPPAIGDDENMFFTEVGEIVAVISVFFLSFIKPTSITSNIIDFDGFRVGIGYACSGVESISVFISAVIAYFVSIKERNVKKMGIYVLIGGSALFLVNILRVIILILVGYNYGTEQMLFVHANLGWILFALGMGVFWWLVFREY